MNNGKLNPVNYPVLHVVHEVNKYPPHSGRGVMLALE